jgi:hypothetical protein
MDKGKLIGLPRAIGVLTAWLQAGPKDPDAELMWDEILATVDEGTEAEVELTVGLAKLGTILLTRLEHAERKPAGEILQDLAKRYNPDG